MNEQDVKGMLIAGLSIPFYNVGLFTPLTIKEIFSLGESTYMLYLSALLINKNHFEQSDIVKEHSLYELLLARIVGDVAYKIVIFEALELFFNQKPQLKLTDNSGFIYFEDEEKQINASNFEDLQHLIKLSNYLKIEDEEDEEYNFANEQAKKMWEKIMKKKKKKPQPKQEMDLHSLYSSISCRFNNYNETKNMTMY